MEKLSLGLIGCLVALSATAQDSLYVFQVKGEVIAKTGQVAQAAKKGTLLTQLSSINLGGGAGLTAIDQQGNTYQIDNSGTYGFSQLIARKGQATSSNMTSQYLTYVWKEFTGGEGSETLIGATFRGDVLMYSPMDSARVVASKVLLTWATDGMATNYYVFIRNVLTGNVTKFETDGSHLAIYGGNPVLAESSYVEWAVTTEPFPNVDNMPFYSFELIDRNTYKQLQTTHQSFIDDLASLGMDEREIAEALCETFGICRFY